MKSISIIVDNIVIKVTNYRFSSNCRFSVKIIVKSYEHSKNRDTLFTNVFLPFIFMYIFRVVLLTVLRIFVQN